MRSTSLLLPGLALSLAAGLWLPARNAAAFSLLGSNLNPNERDVRVFDNFADTTAHDNNTPDAQFPGQTGLQLAVWKAVVEWGSQAHGDGSGDPTQAVLGNGGANFDALWAGTATGVGDSNTNVVSKVASCSSGVLAYCEAPFGDGWRIRFCESWTWNDGPGSIPSGQFDLQGVMCHEYGHALGLGHSTVGGTTMFPSVGSGVTSTRSIEADDVAGIKAIYGTRDAGKPTIVATVAQGGVLTVHGTNFTSTGNQVWFAPAATTSVNADPRVIVSDLSSNGTVISVPIPAAAAPGDVIVKIASPGHGSVSNAFPTDLVGTFGTPPVIQAPDITSITPGSIEALIPGTAQTITLGGTDLDLTTAVLLDGSPVDPARYTIVGPSTITLDMPQVASLGAHTLGVTDGVFTDLFGVTVVAPAAVRYELGTGDLGNVVDRSNGLPFRLAGAPGSVVRLASSPSSVPSVIPGVISLDLGNNFANLVTSSDFLIPAAGWLQVNVPTGLLVDPGPGGLTFFSQAVDLTLGAPYPVSNLQSIFLVQ